MKVVLRCRQFLQPLVFSISLSLAVSLDGVAQYPPLPPVFPTSFEECQTFSTAVGKFYSEMRTQHEKCLADNAQFRKPTPEPPNSRTCSQSACQTLHDYVYGTSEEELQKDVVKCQRAVQERTDRDRREKAESDKRDHEDIDRVATDKAESDKREEEYQEYIRRRTAKDAEQRKATEAIAQGKSVSQSESSQTSEQSAPPTQQPIAIPAYNDQPRQRSQNEPARSDTSKPEMSLVDPYFKTGSAEMRTEGVIVDPYGGTVATPNSGGAIVDPYGTAARRKSGSSEAYISGAKKTFETAIEASEKTLAEDMAEASRSLTGKRLQEYLQEARDTKDVMGGLGKIVKGADYATLVAAIYKADTDEHRSRAEADLGMTFAKDVASKGISAVATRLFPRAAAVLSGPVGWVTYVGSEVLTPVETSRDFTEVIRDNSGASSLSQKQNALFHLWKAYDRYGSNWSESRKRNLLKSTEVVYQEATTQSQ
jgi:hypothetical protein